MGKNFMPDFLAVGAAQGAGAGLLHQRSLQEAYDMEQQKTLDTMNVQKSFSDAEGDNKIRENAAKIKAVQDADTAGQQLGTQATQATQAPTNPAGNAGNTPVPGVPQGLGGQSQGQIQPRLQPMGQPQGNNLPTGQAPTAQNTGQTNDTGPQGVGQPGGNVPLTPPSPADIPPGSPASQVAGKITAAQAQQTQDPIDALKASWTLDAQGNSKPAAAQEFERIKGALDTSGNLNPANLNQALAQRKVMSTQGKTDEYDNWLYKDFIPQLKKSSPANLMNASALQHGIVSSMTAAGVPPQLTPLSAGEKANTAKLMQTFNGVDTTTDKALNAISEITNVAGKTYSGLGAETRGTIATTWMKMFGAQPSDEATNTGIFGKAAGNLTNQVMIGLKQAGVGNLRMGAQIYTLEGKNVPSLQNSDAANLEILRSISAGMVYNKDIADAARTIASIPGIRTNDIESELMHYTENNPPFLKDGVTPNPDRMPYQVWVNKGSPEGVTKGSDMRKEVQGNIETKRAAAMAGENPANVSNATAPKTIHFNDLPE